MSRRSEFVQFVIERMSFVEGLRAQAMFGGYGVYEDDCIFAIIVHDRLYLKSNPTTRGEFEAKGLSPFAYIARGKSVKLHYFEAPPEVFEEPEAMRGWVQKALRVAVSRKKTKTSSKTLQRTRKKPRAVEL